MSGGPNNQLGRIVSAANREAREQLLEEMAARVSKTVSEAIAFYHETVVVPLIANLEATMQQVAYLSMPWYKRAYLNVRSWGRNGGLGLEEGTDSPAGDSSSDVGSEPGHDGSAAAAPGIEADNATGPA